MTLRSEYHRSAIGAWSSHDRASFATTAGADSGRAAFLRDASGPAGAAAVRLPPSRPSDVVQEPFVRESKVTVKIPRPLYRRIQAVVEGSGFNSPTDFIVYVLRDLMGEAEEPEHKQEFTQEELDDVKRKLKNLGYL